MPSFYKMDTWVDVRYSPHSQQLRHNQCKLLSRSMLYIVYSPPPEAWARNKLGNLLSVEMVQRVFRRIVQPFFSCRPLCVVIDVPFGTWHCSIVRDCKRISLICHRCFVFCRRRHMMLCRLSYLSSLDLFWKKQMSMDRHSPRYLLPLKMSLCLFHATVDETAPDDDVDTVLLSRRYGVSYDT